jgi:outer membrane protein OmpA-like peptidoglycan-associated protein
MVICHTLLNNSKLTNTRVFVWSNGVYTHTLNTKAKSEFMLDLDFGKRYRVYLQNEDCPLMFFEVMADNIPREKYDYTMSHEFNASFVHKTDEDIDTNVFSQPFYRIMFDGKKKMVDDTSYNNKFAATVLKKQMKENPVAVSPAAPVLPVILAGKVFLSAGSELPMINKTIMLLDKNGKPIATTRTNRFGAFCFNRVKPYDAKMLQMEISDAELGGKMLNIVSSGKKKVLVATNSGANRQWELGPEQIADLTDNNYSTNIGGKLVCASSHEKKFFSNKDVYLANRLNTVIKKTKTNTLGTFVFEDIRPDHQYFLGVNHTDLKPGERVDLLSKEDQYIATLDTITGDRNSTKVQSTYNKVFNDLSIGDDEVKMDIKGHIFGDNVNNPIGKLKIVLLNDTYEAIDSAVTDNFGTFKFKYLPFLKRFYLSAENTDNILDVFRNILIYSSDNNLIKIMTHQKGKKFTYNPVAAELTRLRDIELDDPWLELIDKNDGTAQPSITPVVAKKPIIENILFESNRYDVNDQAKEILDKIILVMNSNRLLKLEIGAHTDSRGSDAANMKLSEMRAKSVTEYMIKAGIDTIRLTSRGYGETKLLNKCSDNVSCSDLEHAQNRRIEFKILD